MEGKTYNIEKNTTVKFWDSMWKQKVSRETYHFKRHAMRWH
jgi:hypothetical protein